MLLDEVQLFRADDHPQGLGLGLGPFSSAAGASA
jgi:hypothetical protein